jgi:ssDNA-binding Zn-finger/Zn-ribbon topoisomerase 1
MIEGICPKCGQHYRGWALCQPRNQSCSKCGAGLILTVDDREVFMGYSHFSAVKHTGDISIWKHYRIPVSRPKG